MRKWVQGALGMIILVQSAVTAVLAANVYVPIALSGQAAPGTADAFLSLDTPTISPAGQVAFMTTLSLSGGGTARAFYAGQPGVLAERARVGGVAPGTGGTQFSGITSAMASDAAPGGAFSLHASLTGTSTLGGGIFTNSGSGLNLIARAGTTDPTFPAGVRYWSFPSFTFQHIGFNNAGQTLYNASLEGTGVTTSNDNVLMLASSSSTTTLIAREGNVAPGDTRRFKDGAQSPSLNHAGDLVFNSPLEGGQQSGVWYRPASTGVITKVAATGEVAPGTGGRLYAWPVAGLWTSPSINNSGRIAFQHSLSGGGTGIFEGTHAAVAPFVLTGDTAPGTVADGTFSALWGARLTNANGVSFSGKASGTGVDALNDEGIWAWAPGVGIRKVFREGETFPGLPDGVVVGIGDTTGGALSAHDFNADGWLVALVPVNGTGVNADNDKILLSANVLTGERQVLLREGELFQLSPTDARTIASISLATYGSWAADTGRSLGLNDANQLVFQLAFTDGSSGVFMTAVPEPAALAAAAVFLTCLIGRRRP